MLQADDGTLNLGAIADRYNAQKRFTSLCPVWQSLGNLRFHLTLGLEFPDEFDIAGLLEVSKVKIAIRVGAG